MNFTRRVIKNQWLADANPDVTGVITMAIVKFKDGNRVYTAGNHQLKALDGVSFFGRREVCGDAGSQRRGKE